MRAPLDAFTRVPLLAGPSRLQRFEAWGDALGISLYVKRDDEADPWGNGSKVRKLEFVLGEARAAGCDTLISAGAWASNQCRALAMYAAMHGLRAVLHLHGDRAPSEVNGNALTAALFGAKMYFHAASRWDEVDEVLRRSAACERRAGRRPFVVAPGMTTGAANLGYARMAFELHEQSSSSGKLDFVVLPHATGGSQTGLALGRHLAGASWRTIGVCTMARAGEALEECRARLHDLSVLTGVAVEEQFELHDGALGGGYGQFGPDSLELLVRLASEHGVLFDPVYSLKAYVGLVQLVAAGTIPRGSAVALVHTGGSGALSGLTHPAATGFRSRLVETLVVP